jgi:hypothetical protein
MTKDEALELALEALENVTKDYVESRQYKHNKAITAIKQALAAPVQEPVAIVAVDGFDQIQIGWLKKPQHNDKLYTTPPAATTKDSQMALEQPRYGKSKVFSPAAQPAPVQEPVASLLLQSKQTFEHNFGPSSAADWIYSDIAELMGTTPPAAQRQWVGLTDIEKLSVCRVGPVYAPDGVVTRAPIQYRKELEGVALMAVRQAEAKLKEKNA